MVTLEREPMSVSAQGNGGVELQPQPESADQEVVVFQERKAKGKRAEIVRKKADFVAEAWEKGWNTQLTGRQSLVLERYGDPNSNGNGRILSLRGLQEKLKASGDNISFVALGRVEKIAFIKLEAIKEKEKEKENLAPVVKNLCEGERLTPYDIARRLRTDLGTIHEIIEKFDIKKKKRGRPLNAITINAVIINDPVSALFIIRRLSAQGLSHSKIASLTGVTERIVEYRLGKSES